MTDLVVDEPTTAVARPGPVDHEVIVVGAGFSGLGAAIQLRRMGIDDLVILDREDDLGGTWHVNRYPGWPRRWTPWSGTGGSRCATTGSTDPSRGLRGGRRSA